MASCISVSAPKYRIFLTVQRCLRKSITNTQKKHLCCRELRTYAVSNCCVLAPMIRRVSFPSGWTGTLRTPVLTATRNNAFFHTGCNRFYGQRSKSNDSDDILKEKKMTLFQKMKYLLKNYWHVAIPVHLVTSCIWLGSFYYLSVSGIDIVKLLQSLGAPDSWVETIKKSRAAHFVTMYTLYKLASPIRYTVTIGGTTLSINYLRRKGWIKPVLNKDQLKKMYQEQKGAFKDFTASCQDKIQSRKGDLIKTKDEIKQHYVEARDGLQKSVIDTQRDLKKGAKEVTSEWKHVGGLFYKSMKELSRSKPKPDYVAKLIKDTDKK